MIKTRSAKQKYTAKAMTVGTRPAHIAPGDSLIIARLGQRLPRTEEICEVSNEPAREKGQRYASGTALSVVLDELWHLSVTISSFVRIRDFDLASQARFS